MADGSGRVARMPRDERARERLRAAQQLEAAAVAAVFMAQGALQKAWAKRDAAAASATAAVDEAQALVAAEQAALVRVSGLERAALLLGLSASDLRKSLGRTRRGRTDHEQRR